jgi:hypothetical protein
LNTDQKRRRPNEIEDSAPDLSTDQSSTTETEDGVTTMMKNLAVAAALVVATAGLATSASAGYGHRHHGWGHKHFHGYTYYKPVHRHYKPVYSYRHYYKPACSHYGWGYRHGYKVWKCLW